MPKYIAKYKRIYNIHKFAPTLEIEFTAEKTDNHSLSALKGLIDKVGRNHSQYYLINIEVHEPKPIPLAVCRG